MGISPELNQQKLGEALSTARITATPEQLAQIATILTGNLQSTFRDEMTSNVEYDPEKEEQWWITWAKENNVDSSEIEEWVFTKAGIELPNGDLHLIAETMTALPKLTRFVNLKEISLIASKNLTNEGIQPLEHATDLEVIALNETNISTLPDLSGLTHLKRISLAGCKNLTNEGIKTLEHATDLEEINLSETNISELPNFSSSQKLKTIYLYRCENFKFISTHSASINALRNRGVTIHII